MRRGIHLDGRDYTDKEEAGKMVLDVCAKMTGSDAVYLGQYRGFSATIAYEAVRQECRISLRGTLSHSAVLGIPPYTIRYYTEVLYHSRRLFASRR